MLDDEYNLLKAGLQRVVDGKIDDKVPMLVHRVNLLQPAVAASHAGCHNYQYRLFHASNPPVPRALRRAESPGCSRPLYFKYMDFLKLCNGEYCFLF